METGRIPSMQETANRLAIAEVLAMHSRGVDRADTQTLKSCYWPDAQVAYGGFEGAAWTFCESLPDAIKNFTATQHSIGNVLIEWMGDTAHTETYVTACHLGDEEMTFLGRYLDVMERRGDVWKIRHRQVVMDWNRNFTATTRTSGAPFDGLARGGRYPDDPLCRHIDSALD